MRPDDRHSLVYDSSKLKEAVEIIGMPRVCLRVAADAPLYQWTVRLEDVNPAGKATLVSGGLINPSQRLSRLDPRPLVPGEQVVLTAAVHFTTWRFKPGHRIRLSVANAQFPMAWPTPYKGRTTLFTGADTWLELPVPPAATLPPPVLPKPEGYDEAPNARTLHSRGPKARMRRHKQIGRSVYTTRIGDAWVIDDKRFHSTEFYRWTVKDSAPEHAKYTGTRMDHFRIPGNNLRLRTHIAIESDERFFTLTITRKLYQNRKLAGNKTWSERIPRDFQ